MIKQVILLRDDLNMRKGKMVAQGCHASMKVFFDRGTVGHLDQGFRILPQCLIVPLTSEMAEWVEGTFAKIVLLVTSEELLLRAHEIAKERGLPTALVTDLGFTEFQGQPTHTAVAIGPAKADDIDPITGPGGLVPTRLA